MLAQTSHFDRDLRIFRAGGDDYRAGEAQEKLVRQAAAHGTDVAGYVSKIVEETARKPFSLQELSGPVYKRFLESRTTDDELSEELERGKHELRAERRQRQAS